jgi:dipeptidyl aminopeptidase/acylaminoacyl peptidase
MKRPLLLGLVGLLTLGGRLGTAVADPADALRPAAIQTHDVPPIPAAFAQRLWAYAQGRSASFAGWDPAGRGILVRTRFGNAPQLHRVYEPGGRREQITFFDEPVSGSFIPKAADGGLVYSLSLGGSENDQLYFWDPRRFQATLLTDGQSKNRLDVWRPDGERMIVASNRRNGRDTDLWECDPRQAGAARLLLEARGEFWNATDWSADGKTLLALRYVSINEAYPALIDVATGQRQMLPLPSQPPCAVSTLKFTSDPSRLYIVLDADSEWKRLATFDLRTHQYDWLTDDIPWDVSSLEVDRTSGQAAFTVNADGVSQLYLLSPLTEGKRPMRRAVELPLGLISGLEFSPDGRQLGLTLARPDAPADAYALELQTGQLVRWTYSEVGPLDPTRFVTARKIRFPSFDGREIPGWYFQPPAASASRPAPVLVIIHGGPEGQAQPAFSGTIQFYVQELGLAVILPNVRGSAGYGKTYLKLDNGLLREDAVKDIGALLDWIERQPELDARRVAVSGGSYGGYMVLASLVHFGARIRAGIDVVGIANFNTFLANTSAYRVDLRRAEYGDERDPQMRAFFERISPANHADKIVSALLVAHGRNDPRVPFSEAEQIAQKVRQHGRSVWTVFADNEGHGFAKKDNADYLRAVEAYFLKQHLELP